MLFGLMHDKSNNPVPQIMGVIDANGNTILAEMTGTHLRNHLGQSFWTNNYATNIANNGTVAMWVKTGAIEVHGILSVSSSGDSLVQLMTGGTITAGTGSAMTVHNRRLKYDGIPPYTSKATFALNPTITVPGNAIISDYLAGGKGGNAGGINTGGAYDDEFIFPVNNSAYYFLFTNVSGVAASIEFTFNFYEFTIPY